ncbi:MAG: FAD/NAD(P)-binding protein [Planctomycetota bacterium]
MKNPYLPTPVRLAKVTSENEAEDLKTFDLAFVDPEDAKAFKFVAGQFAMVSINGIGEAPFGIASSPMNGDILQFTVKRYPAGVLTTALHDLSVGQVLGLRGPFGNGYPVKELESRNILVVGGGFALTTLRSLANYVLHKGNRAKFGEFTMFVAARNPGEMLYKEDLARWSKRGDIEVVQTIDSPADRWKGKVGYAAPVLKELAPRAENTCAIVCGPPIMIKTCLFVLFELGFPHERIITSMEMKMKCGIGKCGRCNIGSKYVCKDGPVFTYRQLQELSGEY